MERSISAGFGGVGAGVRQAKAEQIKDVRLQACTWENFLRAIFGEVGLTWELVGLDGDYRCLAPGQQYKSCFLVAYGKPGAMRLTAKLWFEPPKLRSTNFPMSSSKRLSCWPSLPKDAGQPNSSSYRLSVLLKLSACISQGILLLPTGWEEKEGTAAPSHPLRLLASPPGAWARSSREPWAAVAPLLLFFLSSFSSSQGAFLHLSDAAACQLG